MPQAKGQKQQTRRRIVDAAARLFAAKGFQATSIDEVMRACRLTRGGFYAHFDSKAQLYQEAIETSHVANAEAAQSECDRADWLSVFLATCGRDLNSTSQGASPWAFLACDIASADPEVRRGYSVALKMLCGKLQSQTASSRHDDDDALVTAAMLIGALAINLSIDDTVLKHAIAEACRTAARKMYRDEPMTFFWTIEKTDAALLPRYFRRPAETGSSKRNTAVSR